MQVFIGLIVIINRFRIAAQETKSILLQVVKLHLCPIKINDFEIYALAVSIINGPPGFIGAHANQLIKHEFSKTQIQMVAKISAIVNSL